MPAIPRLFNFYLNFQDHPLSKMSVAKLKEEGDKAMHKEDYNAALEFYTMVCYCTICGPEVNFFSPTIFVSFVSIALAYNARANNAWALFAFFNTFYVVFLDIRRGV
jgi:hypothetical protein